MTRLVTLFVALLFCAAPASSQVKEINLGSIFDAVKGISKSQQVSAMSEEEEIAIGKEIAASTFGSYRIVQDEALQRYINRVGLWVALQSSRPNLPWRFAAVSSPQINAFAVPGGAVLITTGMLQLLANEAELACVIGHEIGHVTRKHHLALLQKELLIQTGTKVVADNIKGGGAKQDAKRFLVGEGSEIYNRSLDRDSEREADSDGVLMAARAGYDPGACLLFMQRMAGLKLEAGTLESLYKTHPQARERTVDVERVLGQLDGIPAGSGMRPQLGYALTVK